MASLVLSGDTSGSITVSAPAVAGSTTQTLVNVSGTLAPIVSGTAQTAPFTDNTRAEFTGIPTWVKRITVTFSNVSTNGTSSKQIQIGSGSFTTSGYVQSNAFLGASVGASAAATSGLVIGSVLAADVLSGQVILSLLNPTSNLWVCNGFVGNSSGAAFTYFCSGNLALSGTLDRVRVTTINGTDTFDTGSAINILYE